MVFLKNKRWLVDVAVFILAFVAPWWLSYLVALGGVFLFRRYVEIVILGILVDALYSGPVVWFGNFPYTMTLFSLVILMLSTYLKPFLRSTM